MSYKIDGDVYKIYDVEQVSDTFKKQLIIIKTPGQYPQHLKIEFTQSKILLLEGLKVGDAVSIDININGREYTDKKGQLNYFNSINGWKVEILAKASENAPLADPPPSTDDDMAGDLPF
jgi:hypothetical protein